MPYGFIQRVPANTEIYAQIREKLGDEAPAGLVAHVVRVVEGGLQYIDVWETEGDWRRFQDERVEPTVTEVLAGYGIPHTHEAVSVEDIEVIDVMRGEGGAPGFGFVQRVPATADMYDEIRSALPQRPEGLVVHIVRDLGDSLEYTDVWESHDLWLKFKNVTLVPVVNEVLARHGVTHTNENVTFDTIEVIDAWLP